MSAGLGRGAGDEGRVAGGGCVGRFLRFFEEFTRVRFSRNLSAGGHLLRLTHEFRG